MTVFFKIIVLSILIEAFVENLQSIWDKDKFSINRIIALISSIIICFLCRIDIFEAVGVPTTNEAISYVLTGVIVSRGANFVYDIIKKISELEREKIEQ